MKNLGKKIVSLLSFLFIIYSLVWFVGAHLIKGQIQSFLKTIHSEDIKFDYKDIDISGYPYKWSINIKDINSAKLEIDNIAQVHIPNTRIEVNLLLNSLNVTISNQVKLTLGSNFDSLTHYNIVPLYPLTFSTTLSRSLYTIAWHRLNSLRELFSHSTINSARLAIYRDEIHNSTIDGLKISFTQEAEKNQYEVDINFVAESQNPKNMLQLANFTTKIQVGLALSESKVYYIKDIIIKDFTSKINNTSEFQLTGNLNFKEQAFHPKGSLILSFTNYPELVDILSLRLKRYFEPKEFKAKMFNIIAKATNTEILNSATQNLYDPTNSSNLVTNNAMFDIAFTEEGIMVGGIELNEFNQ